MSGAENNAWKQNKSSAKDSHDCSLKESHGMKHTTKTKGDILYLNFSLEQWF